MTTKLRMLGGRCTESEETLSDAEGARNEWAMQIRVHLMEEHKKEIWINLKWRSCLVISLSYWPSSSLSLILSLGMFIWECLETSAYPAIHSSSFLFCAATLKLIISVMYNLMTLMATSYVEGITL